MPFDATTGLYTSSTSYVPHTQPFSLFDLVFSLHSPSPSYTRSDPSNKTWLVDGLSSATLTYEQALSRTLDFAKAFAARGVGEKSAVVLVCENHLELGAVLWSAWRQGAVVACINLAFPPDEISGLLTKSSSSFSSLSLPFSSTDSFLCNSRDLRSHQAPCRVVCRPRLNEESLRTGGSLEGCARLDGQTCASLSSPQNFASPVPHYRR
jgi:hypothetical protein